MEPLTLIFIALLLISNSLLAVSLIFVFRSSTAAPAGNEEELPPVTILIAAKNESHNIPGLLEAMNQLDYPAGKLEIILIDDNSADNTFEAATAAAPAHWKIVRAEEKEYPAKKGALAIGLEHAAHQHIMVTDADCRPRPGWVKAFAAEFLRGNDFVFGSAPFFPADTFINAVARYENFRSFFLMFAAAGMGLPYSAAARSFGYSREAYEKTGGYAKTLDTISGDDDLLLREATRQGLRTGTVTSPEASVYSEAALNWSAYFRQRARHTTTANHYRWQHKLFLGFWHLLNMTALALLIPGYFYPELLAVPAAKVALDIATALLFSRRLGTPLRPETLLYLPMVYEILLIIHYFSAVFRNTTWK